MDLIEGEVIKVEAKSKPDLSEVKISKEESKKIEEAKEAIKKWISSASMQGWRTKQNEVVISTSEAESKPAENETDKKTSKKEFIEKIKKATEDSKEDKLTNEADSKPTEIKAKPGKVDIKKMEAESNKTEESKKIEEAKEAIKKWMTSASMQGWRTKQNEVISTSETESKPTENEMTDNKTSKNESNTCKIIKISKIQSLEKINEATKDSNQDKVASEAVSKPTEKQMDNQTAENLGKVDIKVDADLDEAKNKEIETKTVNAVDKAREEMMETNEAKEKDSATKRKADETEPIHVSVEKVAKISGENVVETAKEKKTQT